MTNAKLIIAGISMFAVIGLLLGLKTAKENSILYYQTNTDGIWTCLMKHGVTTTIPQETLGTIPPPMGGMGWYTTVLCDISETFKAKLTSD